VPLRHEPSRACVGPARTAQQGVPGSAVAPEGAVRTVGPRRRFSTQTVTLSTAAITVGRSATGVFPGALWRWVCAPLCISFPGFSGERLITVPLYKLCYFTEAERQKGSKAAREGRKAERQQGKAGRQKGRKAARQQGMAGRQQGSKAGRDGRKAERQKGRKGRQKGKAERQNGRKGRLGGSAGPPCRGGLPADRRRTFGPPFLDEHRSSSVRSSLPRRARLAFGRAALGGARGKGRSRFAYTVS
jgi:hypothetical protein